MAEVRNTVLGIDTGGTFTDGVILDMDTGEVMVKAKALTTKNDLSIGIGECIEKCIKQMPEDFVTSDIKLVNLSTTLATNAVVEGKKSRVGLIASNTRDLTWKMDVEERCDVSGKVELNGKEIEPIDIDEVIKAVKSMAGKIDSLVVSGFACVRNPSHEQQIKKIAADYLDVPVICAHELTSSLGFNERTVTAVLNAHLLPVIDTLVKKTARSLKVNGIDAPVYFMKGDGAMISESQALIRPVETVLSGPAASVNGGAVLTDTSTAFVIDIGGTTLDAASMEDGTVAVNNEGSMVGGWQTRIRAADIFTTGLGGDSRLHRHGENFSFGPEKSVPICCICEKYPYYISEVKNYAKDNRESLKGFMPFDGLILNDASAAERTGKLGTKIAEILEDGPHCAAYIAGKLTVYERITGLGELLEHQLVSPVTMTPTDLLHIKGTFTRWDAEASIQYIAIAADCMKCEASELTDKLMKKYKDQLTKSVIESILYFEGVDLKQVEECKWMDRLLFDSSCRLGFRGLVRKPIVALGASARIWLGGITDSLDAEVECPEHADVANAVGAARGVLGETIEVVIAHDLRHDEYNAHLPWTNFTCGSYEEAKEKVMSCIELRISELEKRDGVAKYSYTVTENNYGIGDKSEDGEGQMVFRSNMTVKLAGTLKSFSSSKM